MPEEQKHYPAEEAATVHWLLQWKWTVMGFHSEQEWVHITVFIPCGEQRIVYLCVCLVGTPPSELIPGNPQQCCWQTTHRIKVWSVRQWEDSERWKWGSGRTKEKNQMWCDVMQPDCFPPQPQITHIWIRSHIHAHSQTNGCVPAVAEYGEVTCK